MFKEIIEKTGSLIPILTIVFGSVSIRGLFVSFFTSLSYDSFDMRLLPRDKFSVIKFKKDISIFLIIIPVYCLLAFLLAYEALILPFFLWIIVILFVIATLGMLFTYLTSFLEYIYIKSANIRWFILWRGLLGKLSSVFEMNAKAKAYIILYFLLLTLTMISYSFITNTEGILTNITEYLIVMIGVSLLFIFSLKSNVKQVEYIFLEEGENLDHLLEKNNIDKDLKLEYFLTDSIAVLSSTDKEFRVIKRVSESKSIFEIYKFSSSE